MSDAINNSIPVLLFDGPNGGVYEYFGHFQYLAADYSA